VTLHGDAEIDARGVVLRGDVTYDVPAGKRLELFAGPGGPEDVVERWSDLRADGKPSWQWRYALGEGGMVELALERAPARTRRRKSAVGKRREGKRRARIARDRRSPPRVKHRPEREIEPVERVRHAQGVGREGRRAGERQGG